MKLITDTPTLSELVNRLKSEDFIAVDTEFMREKTYWSHLCLIQVASTSETAIIDPLAEGIDLAPFLALLADPGVLKVFHGGRQDMEIFYQLTGSIPANIVDTQIAAMVLGFGDQIGYETLVKKTINKRVDKSSRFTDWSYRPLSEKQMRYAAEDVEFLIDVWKKVDAQLKKSGRADWIFDELDYLSDANGYKVEPMEMWRRIRPPNTRPRTLAVLQAVAAWREREAQRINIPRGRIMKDETVAQLAAHPPHTADELSRVRQLSNGFANSDRGKQLLEHIQTALALPEEQCPQWPQRPELPQGTAPVADMIKVLMKHICEHENVAPKLIANSSDLEKLAAFGEDADIPALKGWRYDLFGKRALDLMNGKLAISLKDRQISLTEL